MLKSQNTVKARWVKKQSRTSLIKIDNRVPQKKQWVQSQKRTKKIRQTASRLLWPLERILSSHLLKLALNIKKVRKQRRKGKQ